MIRNTLSNTRASTFSILLPVEIPSMGLPVGVGFPYPTGTGFFISPDGYFITALHVIQKDKKVRDDLKEMSLLKEHDYQGDGGEQVHNLSLIKIFSEYDIALLKADFDSNKEKRWLVGKTEFPYIPISVVPLELGEPVYSFGYPLSSITLQGFSGAAGAMELHPRVTSAIVSSNLEKTTTTMTYTDPKNYVLDKALNYGNSGGAIVSTDTGYAHAICSRFIPVNIPQAHLGKDISIMVPSLYGVVSSLNNNRFIKELKELNIPIIGI